MIGRHSCFALRWAGFVLFAQLCGAQVAPPNITPPLQSSQLGADGPTLGNAITSGTNIAGFLLYINGTFDPTAINSVTWLNTSTNVSTTFTTDGGGIQSVTTTQIIVDVPNSLFTLVSGQVTANVTVTEQGVNQLKSNPPVTSNAEPFLINPPMTATGSPLPSGTAPGTYIQPIFTGGTAPYTVYIVSGGIPPGLSLPQNSPTLSGSPTAGGDYTFTTQDQDAWGNALTITDAVQIVATPTIAPPLIPASTPAGTNGLQITIKGTNFLVPVAGTFAGSVAQFTPPGSTPIQLATTVTNAGQIVATVPASLLPNPLTAGISILQPNGITSNSVNFPVFPPSITSLAPASVEAGAAAFTLTVNGANFVNGSQISFAGTALTTTFGNAASLSATVPANLFTTAGPVTVIVTNPGGSTSGTATFTVIPALQITTASPLQQGFVGTAYSATFAATGGVLPYTFALVGTPPAGLGMAGAVLSGTPTTAGIFNFNISATDSAQNTVSKAFQVTIAPALTITTTSLPSGQVGVAYNAQLAATGGAPPYTWTAGGLPPGVTVSAGGALTGTPTANASYTVPATVTDSAQNSARQSFTVAIAAPVPAITSLSPANAIAGGAGFTLTVSGSNFVTGAQIVFGGSTLSTTFVNGGSLTAPVSATLLGKAAADTVTVVNPGAISSAPANFPIYSKLTILTTSLPAPLTTGIYDFILTAAGGVPPYTWSATGLPTTVTLNPATGEIKGTWPTTGNYNVSIAVTDTSGQSATAQYPLAVTTPPITLQIVTPSPLPNATVGTPYSAIFAANGGTSPYTFTLQGSAPPGLPFSQGVLNGTPTTAGQYSFGITATDSVGATATKQFLLTVQPAALSVTGSVSDSTVGATISDSFGAAGGVPPYSFAATGSLPSGASFSNGALTGTLTAAGTFSFTVTATDSAGTTASKGFTIHVTVPPVSVTTASLPNGQVGAAYGGQLAATGGVPPYHWAASGLPGGVAVSSGGALSGTPTATGTFSVSATVTDSAGSQASKSLSITIAAAGLTVTTTSLPNGAVGTAYSASLAATGGVPPYSWAVGGLPAGLAASASGGISGTPTATGNSSVTVTVTDSKGATASASFTVTIAPAALTITTASLSGGVAGSAFSANFAATGGVPPYTWTIGGLPAGVTASAGGALSGTPTQPGSFTVTATVTDSAGSTAKATLTLVVTLPATPPLTFTGLPSSANPGSQSTLQVGLGSSFPVDVTVSLTLTFAPTTGGDDPAVQFSTGGRTTNITVPAGQTAGSTSVGVQTGTVAGTITITAQLTAAGQNVTPSPAPSKTIPIPATAPVITAVSAAATSGGFTVTVTGYSSTRDLSQGVFTFTAASGANLQTGQVTVSLSSIFTTWYQSSTSTPYGSQFTLTQPFTVTGNQQAVTAVSVTLSNSAGTSAAVSASVP